MSRAARSRSPVPFPLTGPAAAPSRPRVPHAASVTTRSSGNGLPARPNAAAFAAVACAASVVPSHATASSPDTSIHGSRPGDSAEHSARNSRSSGASPSRRRAPLSAVTAGNAHPAAASSPSSPAARRPSARAYPAPLNRHVPSVKYTATRAGSDRNLASRASPAASSTSPGGITYVSTPIPTRERTRPFGDSQPRGMAL